MAEDSTCNLYFPTQAWSFGDGRVGAPCSGNGVCVNGACICKDGWTGLADFVDSEGYDCSVNILAYKIEWGIILALAIFSVIKTIPYHKARYNTYQSIKQTRTKKGQSYTLLDNPGALTQVVWFGIGVPAVITLCILKLVDDNQRIGHTYGVSICYMVMRIATYISTTLFQPSLLHAIMNGADRETGSVVHLNRRLSKMLLGFHTIVAILPILSINFPDYRMEIYLVSTGIMIWTAMFFFWQAWFIKKKLTKMLDASYQMHPNEKTLIMKEKLNEAQKTPLVTSPPLFVIFTTFFVFPLMWNRAHDYFFPIMTLVFILAGLKVGKTTISDYESSKMGSGLGSDKPENSLKPGLDSEGVTSFVQQKEGFMKEESLADSTDDSYV